MGAAVSPPCDEPGDEVRLIGHVVRRVTGVEDDRLVRGEPEPAEELPVRRARPLPLVHVGLRPAGDCDVCGVDAVEAPKVVAHGLVLDDVEVEIRRHDALSDGVVPARDVADRRQAEPPRGGEERRRCLRLRVREHDRIAVGAHPAKELRRHVPPAREMPARHQRLEAPPARQRAGAVGVEERVRVPRRPAPLVEVVPLAVADREWVEADPLVELDVDPA